MSAARDCLLGTVYTWPVWLSSTSDRRRLPEGTEAAAVLRRTERYAQFDRRYNTIENTTAGFFSSSFSFSRSATSSPIPAQRFPAFALPSFPYFLHSLESDPRSSHARFERRRERFDSRFDSAISTDPKPPLPPTYFGSLPRIQRGFLFRTMTLTL